MYQQFYNFSAEPFRLSPDHSFAYSHKGYTKAWAYMEYAFMRAEGFVMITGKPGTGKTTLIGAMVDRLSKAPVKIANLVCTQLQADDLLKMVAYEFEIPVSIVEKGELLQHLTQQLKHWHHEGRRALLIVDEAQDLSVSAMEELRLLTNIQVDSRPLLQIFLLGQPELRKLIRSPRLEQVHQRIIAACHIKPLEAEETEAYVRHRLQTVGWHGDPAISKAVYPLIFKFSDGIPRRINLICSRLLLHCSAEQQHQVKVADVREVIEELQSEHLASGESFLESDFQAEDVFDEVIPAAPEEDDAVALTAEELPATAAEPATQEDEPPFEHVVPVATPPSAPEGDTRSATTRQEWTSSAQSAELAAAPERTDPAGRSEAENRVSASDGATSTDPISDKESTSPWIYALTALFIVTLCAAIIAAVILVSANGSFGELPAFVQRILAAIGLQ